MYLKYWRLKYLPFQNAADPRFFYGSHHHLEALARLRYAFFARRGAAMLTGDIGCGKTTICRIFSEELRKDNHRVALIENPSMGHVELIQEILSRLDVLNPPNNKRELLNVMHNQILDGARKKQETVIIIDEAQVIEPISTFEELRLLLNFRLEDRHVMTLILVGQPELRDIIKGLEQLRQRVAVRYHIPPLDYEETEKYIKFRQEKAGADKGLFTEGAIRLIYEYSKGIPRNINNCCDLGLLVAANSSRDSVDEDVIKKLIADLKEF